ncbi:MAG: low affinity iron permease family protein [bacterium]|nr:low affinity iron permease family protein [bacterium]
MNLKLSLFFNNFSSKVTRATGHPLASVFAFCIILVWVILGPVFHFSDTWQLVINTGTTIITFMMVFIIQQSQNKDTMAIQLKLNELIACTQTASNRLIEIEELTPEELNQLKLFYVKIAALSKVENDIHTSHSIDEAKASHLRKMKGS